MNRRSFFALFPNTAAAVMVAKPSEQRERFKLGANEINEYENRHGKWKFYWTGWVSINSGTAGGVGHWFARLGEGERHAYVSYPGWYGFRYEGEELAICRRLLPSGEYQKEITVLTDAATKHQAQIESLKILMRLMDLPAPVCPKEYALDPCLWDQQSDAHKWRWTTLPEL